MLVVDFKELGFLVKVLYFFKIPGPVVDEQGGWSGDRERPPLFLK